MQHHATLNLPSFSSIELFAGAGGLALGLERAGFTHHALVEKDKTTVQTLHLNRPHWNVINSDIARLSTENLPELFQLTSGQLDLLSGGVPCQSFSYAGKRRGLEDTRGTMFYHYANFLQQLQPKMFLFENVRGLLSHDRGRTFTTILETLQEQGYTTYHAVLNALDYGVAQRRERLFIVGIRNDLVCEGVSFRFREKQATQLTLRDILQDVPPSLGARYTVTKERLFAQIPPGGNWRNLDPVIAQEYMKGSWETSGGKTGFLRRQSWDERGLTVLTSPQMKQTERCHPEEIRPFTVRENARIQSFPDEWEFAGGITSQYKQVGNAVPVLLAQAIGAEILRTLQQIVQTT